MRERIEGELDPRERERRKKAAAAPLDPELVLMEVRDFVELAESGAYIAGDRRVSRTERTKWRVTFRRLATEAQSALHATDSGPAEEAMELMIDLACHADGCFRSDDPLEAAKFVVSQADLAGVPGRPREDHPGGRLFHVGLPAPPVCAVLHRARHLAGTPGRDHGSPDGGAGDPAGPQPANEP